VNTFEQPIYVSRRTPASLWQEYRIFSDRVELQSRLLFHTFVIPANEILAIEVRPPLVGADIFRGKGFRYIWALKIDNADFYRHVAIQRKSGFMKRIRFTPDNPEEFVRVCQSIMFNGNRVGIT